MSEDLIDRIYEAAFVPEQWQAVLEGLAARSGSAAGQLLVFRDIALLQFKATDLTWPVMADVLSGGWRTSKRIEYFFKQPCYGFVLGQDYFPAEVREDDSHRLLQAAGLNSQLGTIIPMPTGDLAVFAFERWRDLGPHEPSAIAYMNAIHPHIARAALVACRLGLERAQTAVSALAALGLPAAVLTDGGRMLATNDLFDAMDRLFLPVAFSGVAIADASANRLYQETIAAGRSAREPLVRSIPVKPAEGRAAAVIHVLPLRRAAHDIFSGADILVVANEVGADRGLPATALLSALFDLSPAEARLAGGLAAGKSLKTVAAGMNVSFGSARTYLARVFTKTGTHHQSQLVALLKSARPLAGEP